VVRTWCAQLATLKSDNLRKEKQLQQKRSEVAALTDAIKDGDDSLAKLLDAKSKDDRKLDDAIGAMYAFAGKVEQHFVENEENKELEKLKAEKVETEKGSVYQSFVSFFKGPSLRPSCLVACETFACLRLAPRCVWRAGTARPTAE